MEIEFEDDELRRLARDTHFTGGYDRAIVRAFRMRIQFIEAAPDERVFRDMRSLNFEKLVGDLAGLYSMRLNLQWRLLIKLRRETSGKVVVVVSIRDYH